jgi:hypothetical protein
MSDAAPELVENHKVMAATWHMMISRIDLPLSVKDHLFR